MSKRIKRDTSWMEEFAILPPDCNSSAFVKGLTHDEFMLACQMKVAHDTGRDLKISPDGTVWASPKVAGDDPEILGYTTMTMRQVRAVWQEVKHHALLVTRLYDRSYQAHYRVQGIKDSG